MKKKCPEKKVPGDKRSWDKKAREKKCPGKIVHRENSAGESVMRKMPGESARGKYSGKKEPRKESAWGKCPEKKCQGKKCQRKKYLPRKKMPGKNIAGEIKFLGKKVSGEKSAG